MQVFDSTSDEPPVLPGVVWTTGVAAVALGLSALAGWALEDQLLKQLLPGRVSMRPTTAVCLILFGIAVTTLVPRPRLPRVQRAHLLWARRPGLLRRQRSGLLWARRPRMLRVQRTRLPWTRRIRLLSARRSRWLGVGPAATVCAGLIAGFSMLEYVIGRDLLSSQLFRESVAREQYGGRMALATAISMVVLTFALLAAAWNKRKAAQWLGLFVFAAGAVAVLGYAYGERRVYAADAQSGMGFNTALGLALISLGLLAAMPGSVLTHLFRRPAPGALLSRRLLPWLTIGMPVIGGLRIEGERLGLFGSALGTSIMVFAGGVLVTIVARSAVMSMDRMAYSLSHAWHQYGLVSAGQEARIGQDRLRPQPNEISAPVSLASEAELRQAWLDLRLEERSGEEANS
jgi:hypothetical protein